MKWKEVTKTFMMISNCKKTFGVLVYVEIFQRFESEINIGSEPRVFWGFEPGTPAETLTQH